MVKLILKTYISMFLLCSAAYAELQKSIEPAAYWNFENFNNGVAVDGSGNNHNAELKLKTSMREQELFPSPFGKSLRFSREKQMYLQAFPAKIFDLKQEFTIMFWIKPSQFCAKKIAQILCKGFDFGEQGKAPWPGWQMKYGYGKFIFSFTSMDSSKKQQITTPEGINVPTESWSHICLTYDNSCYRLYMNGLERGIYKITSTPLPSSLPLLIGNYQGNKTVYAFDGFLDEIKIFDQSLNQSQVWNQALSSLKTEHKNRNN
jgi:hypothetical protein